MIRWVAGLGYSSVAQFQKLGWSEKKACFSLSDYVAVLFSHLDIHGTVIP